MYIVAKNKKIQLGDKTLIMGILNVTPDSFSDGGLFHQNPENAAKQAQRLYMLGADIIDVGGESVRPGAKKVAIDKELERVVPTITVIRKLLGENIIISVDTYKSEVARKAVDAGADMINDVSGGIFDKKMMSVIQQTGAAYVMTYMHDRLSHTQWKKSSNDSVTNACDFFAKQLSLFAKQAIPMDHIIIDPGFGFVQV